MEIVSNYITWFDICSCKFVHSFVNNCALLSFHLDGNSPLMIIVSPSRVSGLSNQLSIFSHMIVICDDTLEYTIALLLSLPLKYFFNSSFITLILYTVHDTFMLIEQHENDIASDQNIDSGLITKPVILFKRCTNFLLNVADMKSTGTFNDWVLSLCWFDIQRKSNNKVFD